MFTFRMHSIASVLLFTVAVLQGSSADLKSQCGGYCFSAFKPVLDLLANCQSTKLNEAQVKEEESKIDPRFVKVGSRFFSIENRFKVNWYRALILCRQMDAFLAVIQNEEELNEFEKILVEGHSYWLDITRLAKQAEEKYSSLSSGKVVTFFKWAPQEPSDNYQTEACVNLLNGTMNTKSFANEDNYFICEAIESKVETEVS